MNRYNKISAELVVDNREVLEARPRTTPPTPHHEEEMTQYDEERWDNAPCTD